MTRRTAATTAAVLGAGAVTLAGCGLALAGLMWLVTYPFRVLALMIGALA